jgi:hypothetical protein
MKVLKETVLVAASLAVGLGLAEVAVRLLGAGKGEVTLEQAGAAADHAQNASSARHYVEGMPLAPGVSADWFVESLPPLPNRTQASGPALARFRDFERRRLFAPQAEYVWNRAFVESERCRTNGRLSGFPPTVEAFASPSGEPFPRYRFPASTTTVAGLVTNQFGMRGRPLELVKPPHTIRIAFVGASTTVDFHYFAYSYPEFVEYWLNRLAESAHWGVRIEIINAGREAVGSRDIAAIVRYEVLPLDPDLILYYEGSNQFLITDQILRPFIPSRAELDPKDEIVKPRLPEWLLRRFALARLADRALNRFQSVGEPRKPSYRLVWPAGVKENDPDPMHPNLPLQLTQVVRDLESIRADANEVGAQFVLGSFEWLVSDGLALSPTRHAGIYRQLNTFLWPLRYGDARRLTDFQNRVYRNYAASHNLFFVDVAGRMPQAPDLFLDAIHTTEVGSRVKAWVVLQQIAPWLKQRIDAGSLPRPASPKLPPPPSMAHAAMSTECATAGGPTEPIPDGVAISELFAEYGAPPLEPGPPLKIRTGVQQFSFNARAPLHLPAGEKGEIGVVLRGRTLKGLVGLGVLDSETKDLQTEVSVAPRAESTEIWVPVLKPDRATALIIRNLAEGGAASEMLVDELRVVRRSGASKR